MVEKNENLKPATKGDVEELKGSIKRLEGVMGDMVKELNATHDDVRYVRETLKVHTRSLTSHETDIEDQKRRMNRVERKIGLVK